MSTVTDIAPVKHISHTEALHVMTTHWSTLRRVYTEAELNETYMRHLMALLRERS